MSNKKTEKPLVTKAEISAYRKRREASIKHITDIWDEVALILEYNAKLLKENKSLKDKLMKHS